jgi:hypothetical protein
MAEPNQLPHPVVRRGAGFDANQAWRQFLEEGQHLTPPHLAADHHIARGINAVDLENVLRKIETDRGNFIYRAAPIPRGW